MPDVPTPEHEHHWFPDLGFDSILDRSYSVDVRRPRAEYVVVGVRSRPRQPRTWEVRRYTPSGWIPIVWHNGRVQARREAESLAIAERTGRLRQLADEENMSCGTCCSQVTSGFFVNRAFFVYSVPTEDDAWPLCIPHAREVVASYARQESGGAARRVARGLRERMRQWFATPA